MPREYDTVSLVPESQSIQDVRLVLLPTSLGCMSSVLN
jgi:hypothetical protein